METVISTWQVLWIRIISLSYISRRLKMHPQVCAVVLNQCSGGGPYHARVRVNYYTDWDKNNTHTTNPLSITVASWAHYQHPESRGIFLRDSLPGLNTSASLNAPGFCAEMIDLDSDIWSCLLIHKFSATKVTWTGSLFHALPRNW